jgi:diaminohydroxyphosphoribosylaminopyrimidine deaminase/5-amino-6-(5-phosphoribosylamino)uracil reductase
MASAFVGNYARLSLISSKPVGKELYMFAYCRIRIQKKLSSRLLSYNDDDVLSVSQDLKSMDRSFMRQAIEHAEIGLGGTYPNPAVGCVIVDGSGQAIGRGFHPKAGMPHAEVFALLEASGAVKDGIEAAKSVLPNAEANQESNIVADLLLKYSSKGGAQDLFGGCLSDPSYKTPITAYVTLEPCCHFGKTPPCAMSLVHAGVDRVVVGFRDPNPRVDGGGVKLLQDHGITVDYIRGQEEQRCASIVKNFVNRITSETQDYESFMKGAHRSVLRSLSGRRKAEGTIPELTIAMSDNEDRIREEDEDNMEEMVCNIHLKPSWLEEADRRLWDEEIVLLRLGGVVAKKKAAKLLGARIAKELNACVAQVVGHTALLYRPGSPPQINLDKMIEEKASRKIN